MTPASRLAEKELVAPAYELQQELPCPHCGQNLRLPADATQRLASLRLTAISFFNSMGDKEARLRALEADLAEANLTAAKNHGEWIRVEKERDAALEGKATRVQQAIKNAKLADEARAEADALRAGVRTLRWAIGVAMDAMSRRGDTDGLAYDSLESAERETDALSPPPASKPGENLVKDLQDRWNEHASASAPVKAACPACPAPSECSPERTSKFDHGTHYHCQHCPAHMRNRAAATAPAEMGKCEHSATSLLSGQIVCPECKEPIRFIFYGDPVVVRPSAPPKDGEA